MIKPLPSCIILTSDDFLLMINLISCVELLLNPSVAVKFTVASLTPADKFSNTILTSPFTTVPLNCLPSTVIITVPLALSDMMILAVALSGYVTFGIVMFITGSTPLTMKLTLTDLLL